MPPWEKKTSTKPVKTVVKPQPSADELWKADVNSKLDAILHILNTPGGKLSKKKKKTKKKK